MGLRARRQRSSREAELGLCCWQQLTSKNRQLPTQPSPFPAPSRPCQPATQAAPSPRTAHLVGLRVVQLNRREHGVVEAHVQARHVVAQRGALVRLEAADRRGRGGGFEKGGRRADDSEPP